MLVAEDLDLARHVVQVDEHAAVAVGADAAGDGDALGGDGAVRQVGVPPLERRRIMAAREAVRIGIDAERLQPGELVEPRAAELVFLVVVFAIVRHSDGSVAARSAGGPAFLVQCTRSTSHSWNARRPGRLIPPARSRGADPRS